MKKFISAFNLCILFCILSPIIVNASVSESGVIDVLVEEDIEEDFEKDFEEDIEEDIKTVSESEVENASISNNDISNNGNSDSDSSVVSVSGITTLYDNTEFEQNVLFAIYGVAGIIAFMCGIALAIIIAFAIKDLGV